MSDQDASDAEPSTAMVVRRSRDDQLESVDQRLVELLVRDGRASMTQLAQTVGLSVSAVAARVHRLCDHGVITGFHATVDRTVIGQALSATVRVRMRNSDRSAGFEEWVATRAEIIEIFHCMGNFDYELRLACRDPQQLSAVIIAIRHSGDAVETETTLLLGRVDPKS